MKKFISDYLKQISIGTVATILGALFIIWLTTDSPKIESTIFITEFKLPDHLKRTTRDDLYKLIPESFYAIKYRIADSLLNNFQLHNINRFELISTIKRSLPKELDRGTLIFKIDSLIKQENYPFRQDYPFDICQYYIQTYIKNNGNNTIKDLRFELPGYGYYEYYSSNLLIKNGTYNGNISMDNLRPDNKSVLNIWSFSPSIDEYKIENRQIKYTFENGYKIPTYLKPQEAKGPIYWIQTHIFQFIFDILIVLILFFYIYLIFIRKEKVESTDDTLTQNKHF
jgi:hypothetical protein